MRTSQIWNTNAFTIFAPRAFSTVGLPAARRAELWETNNATALVGLDVHTGAPSAFLTSFMDNASS
jgi:hypothetical protein